jgi:periplasmic divalent cation tolerance protein
MYIVVFITAKNVREPNRIAAKLIEDKLVACANVVKGVKSIFWWEGKVDKADEALLILKSKKSCFQKVVKAVKSLHSYKVPEIIALPVIDGNKDYLNWIGESCSA